MPLWVCLLCSLLLSTLAHTVTNVNASTSAQPIIIDTDIFSDVDDVGALAVANVLHNCGLADLLGIAVNTHSQYGALAVSVINTYFHNPDIPIAALRPLTNETFASTSAGEYVTKIAFSYPHTLSDVSSTPTPVELYRSLLASASANNSVNIISIGFLTNLAALLASPADSLSSLSGAELVGSKVHELVVMGGQYPSTPLGGGGEFNFRFDIPATVSVLKDWPSSVPITFSGFELGKPVLSGRTLRSHAPFRSPVREAYEWYVGRCSTVRESWDPLTILYGVLGLDKWDRLGLQTPFAFGNRVGYNEIVDLRTGANVWVEDARVRNRHWLVLEQGWQKESMADLVDWFLVREPGETRCLGLEEEFMMSCQGDCIS